MAAESRVPVNLAAERAVLGAVLLQPQRLSEIPALKTDDFGLDVHRKIFAAMIDMRAKGEPIDPVLLLVRVAASDGAYASSLTDGFPKGCNIGHYARLVKETAAKRRAVHLAEAIALAAANGCSAAELMQRFGIAATELADYCADEDSWRGLFHSYEEFLNAPPLRFAIDGFLQEAGITLIGGLSGHGKTLIMLSMVSSLLKQLPLFGCEMFQVPRPAARVLYLVPESSIGPFWSRIKLFRLESHVESHRLLVHTLSSKQKIKLTDPRLLEAADGADVFLDTAVRFMGGNEDVEASKVFADALFALLGAGARSVTGAHHAPKGFESQDRMTLENILRGSGDIGAMLCTAWGVRQVDAETNTIFIQNVKARDFEACKPFVIEGRPHIDRVGLFFTSYPPGTAGELRDHLQARAGAPEMPGKAEKVQRAISMHAQGASIRDIAKAIDVSKTSVHNWLQYNARSSTNCPQAVDSAENNADAGENARKGTCLSANDAEMSNNCPAAVDSEKHSIEAGETTLKGGFPPLRQLELSTNSIS